MYWFFEDDPEYGVDLRVLFPRKSLVVPTEDAYVFAWDYLALLARYGRGLWPLEEAEPGREWVIFEEVAPSAALPLKEAALRPRRELLELLSAEVAATALARMDVGCLASRRDGWQIIWPILGDLAMRLTRIGSESEVAFDCVGAAKYPPEFLMSFAWLYINALLRESRQVDAGLPRLSRYL